MDLIVVESPTKARTLSRFLGKDYGVEATMGHIKDLPKSKLSIDVEHDFKPDYQWVDKRAEQIRKLQKLGKNATKIYIATDPDREGEAIASHVYDMFRSNLKFKIKNLKLSRIVFHEITKQAVEDAIEHPRGIDWNLVGAQTARRVLDRLVGYKLSPLLWKKVRRGLSAGRVQSVAVRLIVEREREIEAFKPVEYWSITCEVSQSKAQSAKFIVNLIKLNDKTVEVHTQSESKSIVSDLESAKYSVLDIKKREVHKNPFPPFTTSTMTQAGARIFGWSAKHTMQLAQRLYENGYITYHRTDSLNIASVALDASRDFIHREYGDKYLPERSRVFKTNQKSAQEAHEAIRPTDVNLKLKIKNLKLDAAEEKLFNLIWARFVASQMAQAIYDETTIDIQANAQSLVSNAYLLRASGQIIRFDGWRKLFEKTKDEEIITLPDVIKDEALQLIKVNSEQKFTQPPARYNEASIIKTLEKLGIGRPSTYAPTISTIQARGYVEKTDGKFFASPVGMAVNDFLVNNFDNIVDYQFTAEMEGNLDKIADGKLEWDKTIGKFYKPFEIKVADVEKNAARVAVPVEKLHKPCPECKEGELVIRSGRFGKFISCSRFPDCKYTAKLEVKIDMKCPECGKGEVVVKKTRKGRKFYGCSRYPDCKYASWKNPAKPIQSS